MNDCNVIIKLHQTSHGGHTDLYFYWRENSIYVWQNKNQTSYIWEKYTKIIVPKNGAFKRDSARTYSDEKDNFYLPRVPLDVSCAGKKYSTSSKYYKVSICLFDVCTIVLLVWPSAWRGFIIIWPCKWFFNRYVKVKYKVGLVHHALILSLFMILYCWYSIFIYEFNSHCFFS